MTWLTENLHSSKNNNQFKRILVFAVELYKVRAASFNLRILVYYNKRPTCSVHANLQQNKTHPGCGSQSWDTRSPYRSCTYGETVKYPAKLVEMDQSVCESDDWPQQSPNVHRYSVLQCPYSQSHTHYKRKIKLSECKILRDTGKVSPELLCYQPNTLCGACLCFGACWDFECVPRAQDKVIYIICVWSLNCYHNWWMMNMATTNWNKPWIFTGGTVHLP